MFSVSERVEMLKDDCVQQDQFKATIKVDTLTTAG